MFSLPTVLFLLLIKVVLIQSLTIKSQHSCNEDRSFLKRLHSLFPNSDPICVYSVPNDNHDFVNFLCKGLSAENKVIFVESSFDKVVRECRNMLILDVESSSVCELFKEKAMNLSLKHTVVLGYSCLQADSSVLQRCSAVFGLALVKLFTSQGVFMMDSPFAPVRSFLPDDPSATSKQPFVTSLRGRHVRLATFNFPPFTILRESNNEEVEYDGMEMNLFRLLARYLDFRWGLVELKEPGRWGRQLPNNTFLGGLAQAIQEDADVAFANYWQRIEYLDFMDFGPPLNELSLTFVVRRPRLQYSRWQILLATFTTEVWVTALIAYVLVVLTYWLQRTVRTHPAEPCLWESTLIVFGILTSSSSHSGPPRGLLVWWSFFALLFTTALTGAVVTRLAVPLFSPRVDTYRQAVERGYYWVNPEFYNRSFYLTPYMFNIENSWQMKFVATYHNEKSRHLSKLIKSDPRVMLPVQRWGNDFVILNMPGYDNSYIDMSDFRVVQETTRDVFTAFAFKKNSPLNDLLFVATQSLIDRGLWDYLKRSLTSKGELKLSKQLMVEKDISVLSKPEPFTLLKLYPVFVCLVVGHCLGIAVFLVELCYFKMCR